MPVLENPRHENFAQAIVRGASQREAYRAAGYDVKNDATADANASRLLSEAKVKARIQELQTKSAERTVASKAWVIEKLVENVERAMQAKEVLDAKGNPTGEYKYEGNVANRALELIGKEAGMFVDRKEVGGPGAFNELNDQELQEAILEQTKELAQLDPEFAKQLQAKKATRH